MKRIREYKTGKRKNFNERAITLIALVVTIVIILILAAITITMTLGENGMFQRSQDAKNATIKAMADEEVELAVSNLKMETTIRELTKEESRKFLEDDLKKSDKNTTVVINGSDFVIEHRKYEYTISDDFDISENYGDFDKEKWDKTAVPEDVFVWASDDPNDEAYNTIIGYKETVDNYPILRYPSRCKIINENSSSTYEILNIKEKNPYASVANVRSYTHNVKKKEYPETVTKITGQLFYYDSVESVKLPKSLKEIGNSAFWRHRKLKEIDIPEGVKIIGSNAFKDCEMLEKVTLPKSLQYIGGNAFKGSKAIINITKPELLAEAPFGLPYSNIVIDENAKKDIMTEQEKLEWDKTAVPEEMFYWQSDDPNEIGYYTILGYKSGISNYSILRYPSRCKIVGEDLSLISSISYESRNYTGNIRKKEYSKNVIGIHGNRDNGLNFRNVENVILSDSVRSIGDAIFYGHISLKQINLPSGVYRIGDYAFYGCSNLNELTVPANIIELGDYAFYQCTNMTELRIQGKLKHIGDDTFAECSKLESINLPNTLEYIGDYVFRNCTSLLSIDIPTRVNCIGRETFGNCKSLKSVNIIKTDGVMLDIGYNAFTYCNFSNIDLANCIRSISYYAFEYCNGLTEVTLPGCIKNINNFFYNCNNLRKITISDGTLRIAGNAFERLSELEEVIIPDSVIEIGGGAFSGCSKLKKVRLSNNLKKLQRYTFSYCSALQEITLPKRLEEIEYDVFRNCTNLESIVIPYNVEKISYSAFENCTNLKNIYVCKNLLSIENSPWGAKNATITWNYCIEDMTE